MSQVSNGTVVNLFKKVWGQLRDLQPEDYIIQKQIPFSEKQKVGDSFVEAMVLTAETGWTLAGTDLEAFQINPAIAGTVKQTEVKASQTVLSSVVPWGVLSRSAGGGDKAFYDGTKYIVRNHLKSHGKLKEILYIYGQAPELLGYVSYATATYRGVAFVNGTGTLNGVAFTNGVNAASKAILLSPGNFASGIWVGSEGCYIAQVDETGAVLAEGNLVTVESDYGYITVNFTPVAASTAAPANGGAATSGTVRLAFEGMGAGKDMIGIKKILGTQTGSLFGIPVQQYSLWRGNYINNGNVQFTFDKLQSGVAAAVNRGGLEGDLLIGVNPRTWGKLITTEAGKRMYDDSYKPSSAENGMESITFYHQAGKATIMSHRMVKEGDVMGLHLPDWSRSGSAQISFTIPGIEKEVIFPLQDSAAYAFRSYSDEYIFNHAPARSIWWFNVNDEASS